MKAHEVASIDMTKHHKDINLKAINSKGDRWLISNREVMSKESRKLNRELGLNVINMHKGNMSRY